MLGSVQKRRMLVACVAASVAAVGSAFAQTQPATPAPPATPSYSSSPIQMPTVIPSKSETAPSAFTKLAGPGAAYVSKEQADKLDGFDRAFSEADRDKDGKLTADEFVLAWAIYTGKS